MAAGIDVIQIREPQLAAAELAALSAAIVSLARGTATRVVINDRLDVALATGAHGVHLRSDSPKPRVVRLSVPSGFLIGRSVHSLQDLPDADGADYLIAGTVWPTDSKSADHVIIGVEGFREIASAAATPVLAIGGVTVERASTAIANGAAGIAAIGLFIGSGGMAGHGDLGSIVNSLRHRR